MIKHQTRDHYYNSEVASYTCCVEPTKTLIFEEPRQIKVLSCFVKRKTKNIESTPSVPKYLSF